MHLNGSSPRSPVSGWLSPLDRALRAESRANDLLCLKVAVLLATGCFPKSEIARRLGVTPREVDAAVKRITPHLHLLEREDDRPGAPGTSGAL